MTMILNEDTVKKAVESYFTALGFAVRTTPYPGSPGPDNVAYHEVKRQLWLVEDKGLQDDSANRLGGFQDGLGQLTRRDPSMWKEKSGFGPLVKEDIVYYALALPDRADYRALARSVRKDVRKALNLYLFFIEEGEPPLVTVIPPDEEVG